MGIICFKWLNEGYNGLNDEESNTKPTNNKPMENENLKEFKEATEKVGKIVNTERAKMDRCAKDIRESAELLSESLKEAEKLGLNVRILVGMKFFTERLTNSLTIEVDSITSTTSL